MKKLGYILIPFLVFLLQNCEKSKTVNEFYPNGKLKLTYQTMNGLKDGKLLGYYQSGRLKYEDYYSNNLMNGSSKYFYENGRLYIEGTYTEGKPDGFFAFYSTDGRIDSTVEYVLHVKNSTIGSFFDTSTPNKDRESWKNRYVVYDKKGEPIKEKSAFFYSEFNNDTLLLGDTLKVNLFLCSLNPLKYRYVIHIKQNNNFIRCYPHQSDDRIYYSTKTKNRGVNYFQGWIDEYSKNGKLTHTLFFKDKYYVR
jgi:hypothetical protein